MGRYRKHNAKLHIQHYLIIRSSQPSKQSGNNQNNITPITTKIPRPNQLPPATTLPAAFVFVNGALFVSLAGAPGLEVAAPDCVFSIVEVTASPNTVVEVRMVVVLS